MKSILNVKEINSETLQVHGIGCLNLLMQTQKIEKGIYFYLNEFLRKSGVSKLSNS